jgi:hypothetical protein
MKKLLLAVLLLASIFCVAQANRNDVVIDEIMADPSPPVQLTKGLPEVEFIELKNNSQKVFNLNGWKISDATTTATISMNFMLLPDSFVVISTTGGAALLSPFARSIGVTNFPSLNNDGELIYLTSKDGKMIHALEYSSKWYQNDVKSNGGWTLEMVDTKNTCSGASNWTASKNSLGGTPGRKNSIDAINPDKIPPALLRSYATDSINIVIIFDEPLDSSSAAMAVNYFISDDIGNALFAIAVGPLFDKVMLRLQRPLEGNKTYSILAKNINDCAGNQIGMLNTARVGPAFMVDSFDVVINEILFNPKPAGLDYVELYNRSKKTIDLKDLYLANKTTSGSIGSLKQLSISSRLFFPGDYLVLTESAAIIKQQYHAKNADAFLELNALPSYPDDLGTVILLNTTGRLIDQVSYSEKWHFKLIDNDKGVALERIDFNKPSQDASNWHSAATSMGYGTPTYQNSQFMNSSVADGNITLIPQTFSPDNDGYNDFITVTYNFPEPGYVCNIILYDLNGRAVKYLTRNALCGLTGYFRWDGLDEKNNKLPVGIYIMISEIFNLKGKTKKFKNGIVLAKKLT